MMISLIIALILTSVPCNNAFHTSTNSAILPKKPRHFPPSFTRATQHHPTPFHLTTTTSLPMAGFGGGATNKKSKSKKSTPLKPKAQWDRYLALKNNPAVRVGVKKGEEWIDVGYVKSETEGMMEVAVARQRALIAEHAKRLYPLKISQKDVLEWGYMKSNDDETYTAVSKSVCDDAPHGIEKKIGFEGIPDPQTGFYCHYYEGRMVEKDAETDFMRKT